MNTLIDRIDHIVLTVTDIEVTTQFYEKAFGFEREFFRGPEGQPRHALLFGQLKINLQDRNTETPTKARIPTIGSGDFCLIASLQLRLYPKSTQLIGSHVHYLGHENKCGYCCEE